jgi:pimeloyl-ACP methyl ester carboxylesterase
MQNLDVSFDSGGLRCAATLYRPGGADGADGAVGCVVMGNGITLTRQDGIPDYAQRFAISGFAVVAFDYRHWGDSGGEPRHRVSLRSQLEDWRAAVDYARALEGVDPAQIALWGVSLGGGLALMTAAADPRIAATVAVVPMADGLAAIAQPAPPGTTARLTWNIVRRAVTRRPVTIPVAGAPGSFALITAPEALPGFERLAAGNGWRNEVDAAGLFISFARFRPVQKAAGIRGPVLLQLGERDGIVPLPAIEKASARAPKGRLARYPIDHFDCFWPEHIAHVAGDQLDFLHRHLPTPDDAAHPGPPGRCRTPTQATPPRRANRRTQGQGDDLSEPRAAYAKPG